jgi:hypothetical protein
VEIDSTAPAVARGEIDIAAGPEVVWSVLADIDGWPRWNASIASAKLEGELAPGSTFRWKAGPGTITSTLGHVDPPRELGWAGKTFGIKAVHVYRLEQRGDSTHVTSEESWDGLPVRLLRGRMQKTLQKALDEGLPRLKAVAERRAGGP